ncbi:AfsR/SARP family transcriptional regulator [Streptantibioticus cattleyicolor]|uniref:Regulator n=1 Tax=Streptantibioticus cattleyicolor (strain ATCC 35852 / DSM 46488 / JCM 4925 / NBRC 14057 / NRRL 8057) TaxID=1003195 RepID=F8JJC2_STREN|nr:BTAD domain-containing putative transcriptional regulator [Streptantibioticus cattleyicolor]AEW98763.1 regulator [Streptantibioticus cattleyicolor NRRL 8057 = DSM 46488]CCB72185.1 putative regulator [Streptantibioticus cattleyicolor NRRL 8057 = DSM 46488]
MERVTFGVLGPVTAERGGAGLALKGPRHRAVLARLIVARRRVVPVSRLVTDLWPEPPAGAVGAVQTFVAALRRVLEPERPPRAPARLLVTEGPGYALRAAPEEVDAWRFETALDAARTAPPAAALETLDAALGLWRGPAYAGFEAEEWARGERARLAELRLRAVEDRAAARLALGLAAEAVPDLDAHLTDHPWREDAWRLLALALYRTGRQADALAVLRHARATLADRLGLDPGPALRRLEAAVLAQDPALDQPTAPAATADRLWTRATAAYDRAVAAGARARVEATVGLLRNLAVTGGGGLAAAREHRPAAIASAEEFGDPELTARVIGAYDVPAIWTRSDDPDLAARVVAAARRALAALPPGAAHDAARCRLLATIAVESRGTRDPGPRRAAAQAEELARRVDDPALLAFALNGVFMQSCDRAGLAPRRDAIGAELVQLAARHGLVTYEVLGHLIRLQAHCALGDFPAADRHAAAADHLADRHELPLVGVFTQWYAALRTAATGRPREAEAAYRAAAARLDGAGMPGLETGLLPLALLCLRLAGDPATAVASADPDADWGPYRPWAEPFTLLRQGRPDEARTALRAQPEPPADLLYEALCSLSAAVAVELGDREVLDRVHARLRPAAGQLAGAGSGLLTAGPVDRHLAAIAAASAR